MRNAEQVKSLFDDFCINGNMQSYDELYRLLCAGLIHFSASVVGSFHLAEEIVSDVFIMLWQKRTQLTAVNHPRMYIYICVRNSSLNALPGSQKSGIPFDGLDTDALSVVPDIEQRLIFSEVSQIVEGAIRELPSRCQLIFRLIKIDGLTYKETASLLDISPKTVDAQLAIAIKRLAHSIRMHMPEYLLASYLQES